MLDALRQTFEQMCDRLEEGHAYRSWFRMTPAHDGSAHIERERQSYCYVVTERGSEYERRRTQDPEELLFWMMSDVTFDIAVRYELTHRRPGADSRRLLFRTQEELLQSLKPAWADELRRKHRSILRQHPSRTLASLAKSSTHPKLARVSGKRRGESSRVSMLGHRMT